MSEELREIIEKRDLEKLRQTPDDVLNKYDFLVPFLVNIGWIEGIKEYQNRYKYWAWCIKNCFTVWKERSHDPYKIFFYCPYDQIDKTIKSVNEYGQTIGNDDMIMFPIN